ncbi:hypothetical protein CDAR_52971, partial [Caerostris darwini]
GRKLKTVFEIWVDLLNTKGSLCLQTDYGAQLTLPRAGLSEIGKGEYQKSFAAVNFNCLQVCIGRSSKSLSINMCFGPRGTRLARRLRLTGAPSPFPRSRRNRRSRKEHISGLFEHFESRFK